MNHEITNEDLVFVGDLTNIKEDRSVMEPASNVVVRIKEVKRIGKDPSRWLGIQPTFVVEEGIQDGDGTVRYKGFHLYGTICIYANPEADFSPAYLDKIKRRKHLVDLMYFVKAIGLDLKQVIIDEDFFSSLKGKKLLVNVLKQKNDEGEFENKVASYKAIPDSDLI